MAGASLLGLKIGNSWFSDNHFSGKSLDFKILSAGVLGVNFPGPFKGKPSSVLNEVDFKRGIIRQTALPMLSPHSPTYLPNGNILCLSAHTAKSLIVDSDHKVIKDLLIPKDYVFGGHCLILEDKGEIAIAVKQRVSKDFKASGFLDFYDLDSFKLKRRVPLFSTFAHDIARLSSDVLAVSQYGTLYFDFQSTDKPYFDSQRNVTFLMQPVNPTLSFYDLKSNTFFSHKKIDQYYGLNHISTKSENSVFAVSVQAVLKDTHGIQFIEKNFADESILQQKNIDQSSTSDFQSLPSPFSIFSENGNQSFFLHEKPHLQLRSQDLLTIQSLGTAIASFPNSGTIGILDSTNKITIQKTDVWNIESPRGLVELPDGTHLAISDQESGIAIIDYKKMNLVSSARFTGFRTIHIDCRKA